MSPASRPTEWTALAGAVAFLILRALGVDNDGTLTALAVVLGALPAAVTWIVVKMRRSRP